MRNFYASNGPVGTLSNGQTMNFATVANPWVHKHVMLSVGRQRPKRPTPTKTVGACCSACAKAQGG